MKFESNQFAKSSASLKKWIQVGAAATEFRTNIFRLSNPLRKMKFILYESVMISIKQIPKCRIGCSQGNTSKYHSALIIQIMRAECILPQKHNPSNGKSILPRKKIRNMKMTSKKQKTACGKLMLSKNNTLS